jgi:hypothetical protein
MNATRWSATQWTGSHAGADMGRYDDTIIVDQVMVDNEAGR